MAQKITYSNKSAIMIDPEIAENLKIKAEDMNELKTVINTNADVQVSSSDASVTNIRKVSEDWYHANYDSLLDNTIYITDGQSYAASTSTPVGSILIWPGQSTKLPNNYMLCEGQLLNRNDYRILFEAIGTTYGSGDGSTTFALPNYKGFHPVHLDGTTEFATLNQKGGHKLLQAHTHNIRNSTGLTEGLRGLSGPVVGNEGNWGFQDIQDGPGSAGSGLFIATSTGGGNAENLSPYVVGYYIIKVKTEVFTEDVRNLDNSIAVIADKLNSNTLLDMGLGVLINSGEDLNSYKNPGVYRSPNAATSASLLNCPYASGGFRLEIRYLQSANYIRQTLLYGRAEHVRHWNGTIWSDWLATDSSLVTGTITARSGISIGHGKLVKNLSNNLVTLSLFVNTAATGNRIVADIPAGFRPASYIYTGLRAEPLGGAGNAVITSLGTVEIWTASSAGGGFNVTYLAEN